MFVSNYLPNLTTLIIKNDSLEKWFKSKYLAYFPGLRVFQYFRFIEEADFNYNDFLFIKNVEKLGIDARNSDFPQEIADQLTSLSKLIVRNDFKQRSMKINIPRSVKKISFKLKDNPYVYSISGNRVVESLHVQYVYHYIGSVSNFY